MKSLDRRSFLKKTASLTAAALLAGCAPVKVENKNGRPILESEDRPGFFIRWYRPFEAINPETWVLSIEGQVQKPAVLRLSDLKTLPRAQQASRMRCVDGWSVASHWEGLRLRPLLELVQPQEGANWVHFTSADGYNESIRVDELLNERVLLAYGMNSEPLSLDHGAPLRLILPAKYGYKGPKVITKMRFDAFADRGTWPRTGHYSSEGDIQGGMDVPLDLSAPRVNLPGEIIYPDGLEAQP